jgi:hypothetical protein
MRKLLPLIAILSLTGCASLTTPSAEKMASLPVIEIGQKAPPGHEYILHIAAGKPVPFRLAVAGDALDRPAEATAMVAAKQDVYLYKRWASLDGRHWKPSHDLFKTWISVGLDPDGGKAEIKFDYAKS